MYRLVYLTLSVAALHFFIKINYFVCIKEAKTDHGGMNGILVGLCLSYSLIVGLYMSLADA